MTKRQERLDEKYKYSLCCESCNRWAVVPHDIWRDTIKRLREKNQEYLFLCKRRKCLKSRSETLLSEPDYKKLIRW